MKAFGSLLFFLLTLSSVGQTAFIRSYGASGTFNDGKEILALPDSTYILAGNRLTPGGQSSAWLFRVDAQGVIVWEVYFDEYDLSTCENLSLHNDTSVILTGTMLQNNDYSIFVACVGTDGQLLWEKILGTDEWDAGYSSVSDTSGRVWVTGYSMGYDTLDQDIVLYILDGTNGDSLTYKRMDEGGADKGVYLDTLSGGNIILVTQTYLPAIDSTRSKLWKMDYNMDTVWTMSPTSDSADFFIECAFEDTLGRVVFGGEFIPDTGTVKRFWYGFASSSGVPAWEYIAGPFFLKNIRRGGVDDMNRFYFTGGIFPYYFGFGNNDVGLWIDSAGFQFYHYYGALQDDEGSDLAFTPDGGMVLIGSTKNYGPGVTNIFLVKLDSSLAYNETDYAHYTPVISMNDPQAMLYPNPSSGRFVVETGDREEAVLEIISLGGQCLYHGLYLPGDTFDASGFAPGVYTVKITTQEKFCIFKLLLQ